MKKYVIFLMVLFIVFPAVVSAQAIRNGQGGHVNVKVKDQTLDPIDFYLGRERIVTTTATAASAGATSVVLLTTTGYTANDGINIKKDGHMFQALISSVVGTTVNLNHPLDRDFPAGSYASIGPSNANVNGSVTPQIFKIKPPTNTIWHINAFIMGFIDDTDMDDSRFAGIPALAKGILFRTIQNGVTQDIFIASSNGRIKERVFDFDYSPKAPAGYYGAIAKKTLNGDGYNGTTIELHGDDDDELQMVIQDNLTGITAFSVTVQGHEIEK